MGHDEDGGGDRTGKVEPAWTDAGRVEEVAVWVGYRHREHAVADVATSGRVGGVYNNVNLICDNLP